MTRVYHYHQIFSNSRHTHTPGHISSFGACNQLVIHQWTLSSVREFVQVTVWGGRSLQMVPQCTLTPFGLSLSYRLLVLNRLFEFRFHIFFCSFLSSSFDWFGLSLQKSVTAAAVIVRRRFRFIVALVVLGACVRFAAALAASGSAPALSSSS